MRTSSNEVCENSFFSHERENKNNKNNKESFVEEENGEREFEHVEIKEVKDRGKGNRARGRICNEG